MSIGKKQSADNQKWIDAVQNIKETFPEKEILRLEQEAVDEITSMCRGKKTAYAWSGGKDSLVLGKLCRMSGVEECMFAHTDLEYPAFLDWCLENKPKNCTVINTGQDLKWLSEHPEMLFPADCRTVYKWFQIVQQNEIKKYFNDKNLDIIIVGHRKADGNYVGRGSNISSNRQGIVRYSPMADWSHEAVLAYIAYRDIAVPPIYGWNNGYKCGTHPWPARQYTGSIENGFREVYGIDASIVEAASEFIPEAKKFLSEVVK